MENQCDDSEDSADLSTSQFVPFISYLSPTLGRLGWCLPTSSSPGNMSPGMSPRYSRALFSTAVSASNTAKRKPEVSGRANKKTVLSRSLSLSPESLLLFRIWTCSRLGWTMILSRTRGLRGCCKQLWTSYCVFLLFTMSWYFQIFWWSSQFIRKQGRMRTMQSKVPRRKVPHPRQKRARHCSW